MKLNKENLKEDIPGFLILGFSIGLFILHIYLKFNNKVERE